MNVRLGIPALLTLVAAVASSAFAGPGMQSPTPYHVAFGKAVYVPAAPIIVTEVRTIDDEFITRGVVDTLANDSRLAGRIGVESIDGVVGLSGIVTTAGQSLQAERDAKAVSGVRHVHNQLATRMGGGRY